MKSVPDHFRPIANRLSLGQNRVPGLYATIAQHSMYLSRARHDGVKPGQHFTLFARVHGGMHD